MSKYPVQYQSSSKGLVNIEDMATPHLLNAWRKAGGRIAGGEVKADETMDNLRLRVCMEKEIVARGCTYDEETGRWTLPAPVEDSEP